MFIVGSRDWAANAFKLKLIDYHKWFSPTMSYLVEGFVAYIRRGMERAVEKAVEDDTDVRQSHFICRRIYPGIFSCSPFLINTWSSFPTQPRLRPSCVFEYVILRQSPSGIESSCKYLDVSRMGVCRLSWSQCSIHCYDQTNQYHLRAMSTIRSADSTKTIRAWLLHGFRTNAFFQCFEKSASKRAVSSFVIFTERSLL